MRPKLYTIEKPLSAGEAEKLFPQVYSPITAAPQAAEQNASVTSGAQRGGRTRDLFGGAIYGFSSLGRGVQNLASKGVEMITGKEGFGAPITKEQYEQQMDVDLDTGFGKTGEFLGQTALYATPGGTSMKAGQLAFRAGVGGATEALSTQGVDKGTAATAAFSAFLPPAAQAAFKLFTNAAKGTAGVIGGKGSAVIDEIYKNPEAAKQGLRGLATITDDAVTLRTGIKNIARQASNEFADDLKNLPKRLGRKPQVVTNATKTTIKVDGKVYQLSKQGVRSQLTQALRKFDVNVDPRKKILDFSEAPLSSSEQKVLTEVFGIVDNWKDTTPVGFHKLARKVKNFRKGDQSKELNAIIDTMDSSIKGYLKKRIPAVAPMYKKYETAMDTLKAFNQEYAFGGAGKITDTASRIKTERKIGTLFTGEKESSMGILDSVAGGQDIVARQAGRMMQEQVPRSAASIGDFVRGIANTVITPKMVGETAAFLGTTIPKAERLIIRLQTMQPAARGVFISALADLLAEEKSPEQTQTQQVTKETFPESQI